MRELIVWIVFVVAAAVVLATDWIDSPPSRMAEAVLAKEAQTESSSQPEPPPVIEPDRPLEPPPVEEPERPPEPRPAVEPERPPEPPPVVEREPPPRPAVEPERSPEPPPVVEREPPPPPVAKRSVAATYALQDAYLLILSTAETDVPASQVFAAKESYELKVGLGPEGKRTQLRLNVDCPTTVSFLAELPDARGGRGIHPAFPAEEIWFGLRTRLTPAQPSAAQISLRVLCEPHPGLPASKREAGDDVVRVPAAAEQALLQSLGARLPDGTPAGFVVAAAGSAGSPGPVDELQAATKLTLPEGRGLFGARAAKSGPPRLEVVCEVMISAAGDETELRLKLTYARAGPAGQ